MPENITGSIWLPVNFSGNITDGQLPPMNFLGIFTGGEGHQWYSPGNFTGDIWPPMMFPEISLATFIDGKNSQEIDRRQLAANNVAWKDRQKNIIDQSFFVTTESAGNSAKKITPTAFLYFFGGSGTPKIYSSFVVKLEKYLIIQEWSPNLDL